MGCKTVLVVAWLLGECIGWMILFLTGIREGDSTGAGGWEEEGVTIADLVVKALLAGDVMPLGARAMGMGM